MGERASLWSIRRLYSSLTASPVNPQLVYGKTSSTISPSTDDLGGHIWNALPPPTGSHGSLYDLTADPTNSALLYLGLSYPTEVYRYDQDSGNSKPWTSLTPKAEQQADICRVLSRDNTLRSIGLLLCFWCQ